MSKRFYRIRNLNSLLGEYKELENQEIFFQTPEKLNDPMEGFIDFVFQGDKTVWKNFFKHYILCFEWLFQNYLIYGENDIELSIEHIPVFRSYDELETLEYKKFINSINEEVLSVYGDLISKISTRTTAIKKDELNIYLNIFHYGLLEIIQKVYNSSKLIEKISHTEIDKSKIENIIKSIDSIEELIKNYDVEKTNKFIQVVQASINDTIFHLNYNTRIDKNKPNKHFILNFYTYYLEAIKKLTYPKVYVASFLEDPHNSSVWGNYGKNHTGVCLIFESDENEKLTFLNKKIGVNSKGAIRDKTCKSFEKVDYESDFEEINFFESFGLLNKNKIISTWYLGETESDDSIFYNSVLGKSQKWKEEYWKKHQKNKLIKTKDWAYENEYRIVLDGLMDYEIKAEDRKLKYDFSCLKGLIFGINTPFENKCEIIEIIKEKCKSNNINNFEFYQAYYCDINKNVQYRKLNIEV